MSSKLLNLDDLATDMKTIKLDGNTHVMRQPTVQEFIDKSKEAQQIKKEVEEQTLTESDQVVRVVAMINEAYPTLTVERLNRLPVVHLTAILDFTLTPPEEIEKKAKEDQAKGN